MLFYFIVFTIVGFVISSVAKDESTTIVLILIIAIVWGITTAPIWGLASLGEMALGYFLTKILK
jgi:hypothetical protein